MSIFMGGDYIKRFIQNEEGFISTAILGTAGIVIIVGFIILITLWVLAYSKASDVYEQIGAGMDYAVVSATLLNTTGTIDFEESNYEGVDELLNDAEVFSFFIEGFEKITEGVYSTGGYWGEFYTPNLPDKIIVKDFYRVNAGDLIPPPATKPGLPRLRGEKASQPGYVIYADVPIYEGGLWDIRPARVEMKLYRMLQTSPI